MKLPALLEQNGLVGYFLGKRIAKLILYLGHARRLADHLHLQKTADFTLDIYTATVALASNGHQYALVEGTADDGCYLQCLPCLFLQAIDTGRKKGMEIVRDLYLAPYTSTETAVVASQWSNLVLFALLLVAGLATVAYMVQQVLAKPATENDAA